MLAVKSVSSVCGNTLLNTFKTSVNALTAAFITPVRFRYHEDKPKITKFRWGYKDKYDFRGTLPRIQSSKGLPTPPYVPKNAWSEKKALFGQNDYIDILGDDNTIHPIKFAYGIPSWLRGFNGSEYQTIIRKRNFFGPQIASRCPSTHKNMRKRLKFLYRRINHKTESYMDTKVMRR